MDASPLKKRDIIDALRNGNVPSKGLEHFAVGLSKFEEAIDDELKAAAAGRGKFKAVRGEYGSGKTFFASWLSHRARLESFATAFVQISETETPLYRMETVYRRALESLQTAEWTGGAFRSLIDRWFFTLEEEVLESGNADPNDADAVTNAVGELLEKRLAGVSATQPQFAAALRECHGARIRNDYAVTEGLIAWLMGQPNVASNIKRVAGIKGDLDHFGAGGFLRGLLEVLKQTGRKGLVLVLDEVETIQRVRADSREKSLNALRQLMDDLSSGRYPGLFVVITGTPLFFDGPRGVKRLLPLAQRLETSFSANAQFDNPRAVQIRLLPFDQTRLIEVGQKVRSLYPTKAEDRIQQRIDDEFLTNLAASVTGKLGGKIGVSPRIYLKKLVDVMDRVDQFAEFVPSRDYEMDIAVDELTAEEREAAGIERSVDDIELDLDGDER